MKEFLITDFGARVCDELQTEKIQADIDACFLAGGGKVVIPKGKFLSGGIRLRSNVTLYLNAGAILKGSIDPEDYMSYLDDKLEPIDLNRTFGYKVGSGAVPYSRWNNGLIKVVTAENISIIGEPGSFIDGSNVYDPVGEEKYRGPHAINICDARNVYLEGYTVIDSANWAHNIYNSQNITAKNVTVLAGHDGFDVRVCDNVLVEDCEFLTGDDAIAGFDNKDVVIRNCVLDSACSALRFGGTDVLIENCRGVAPTSYGFRGSLTEEERAQRSATHKGCRHAMHTTFQYYCDFRAVIRHAPGNILIKNCKFENPNAIFLHPFDGEHRWCCNRALNSITYEDCEINGLSLPGVLCADPGEPLDFRLKNVKITAREDGADFPIFSATSCKYIEFDNVEIKGFKEPFVLTDAPDRIKIIGGTPLTVKLSNSGVPKSPQ